MLVIGLSCVIVCLYSVVQVAPTPKVRLEKSLRVEPLTCNFNISITTIVTTLTATTTTRAMTTVTKRRNNRRSRRNPYMSA